MTSEFVPHTPYLLYADDDPDDLFLLQQMLSTIIPAIYMHGCTTGRQAFNFLESLEASHSLPNLIVLDLNMPDWDGPKTLHALKTNPDYSDIPVFIFTNSDHPRHRLTALNAGAVDFITKPYRKEDILKVCSTFATYANQPVRIKSRKSQSPN